MTLLIVCFVVAGVIGAGCLLRCGWRQESGWRGWRGELIGASAMAFLLCGIGGGLIGFAVSAALGGILPWHLEESERTELASLRSNDGVSGSFFLGIGSVNERTYYHYYAKDSAGFYRPGRVLHSQCRDNIHVYEQDRTEGVMKVYVPKFNTPWHWHIAASFPRHRTVNAFYVPAGSITRQFRLE